MVEVYGYLIMDGQWEFKDVMDVFKPDVKAFLEKFGKGDLAVE